MLRALGAPLLVGVVLFSAAVATAVILALARPHAGAPGADSAGGELMPRAASGAAETSAGEPGGGASLAPGGSGGATPGSGTASAALVHVVGKVRRPGVVELAAGARVRDAIEKAGGATDPAALSSVNLARLVVDGEQIVVARARPNTRSPTDGAAGSTAGGALSLNSADQTALEQLPGVGPALAARILEWRRTHGAFTSVEQLGEVSGIGPKTLEGLRGRVAL